MRPRLLLIDNDDKAREIKNILSDSGFDMELLTNSDDAINVIEDIDKVRYDAFLVDMYMPPGRFLDELESEHGRITGYLIARKIREKIPDARIVGYSMGGTVFTVVKRFFDSNRDSKLRYVDLSAIQDDKFNALARAARRVLGEKAKDMIKVFIVHGRDGQSALELKNYLQNTLGFREPIILAERPNMGNTIIEKFEYYASEVDLVFVIATPDDEGGLLNANEKQHPRARQNVIFELGYFFGRFRRHSGRILFLKKGHLETPTDIDGLVYMDITNGIASAGEQIRLELAQSFGF
jgi:predicted nucleotide-binding protein